MKNKGLSSKPSFGKAALAAAVAAVLGASAQAQLNLVYEQGPLTGQSYLGPVQIFVEGLDSGSLYSPGYNTVSGNNVAAGISELNGAPLLRQAPGAFDNPAVAGTQLDDTWFIGYITRIVDPVTNANVWTPLAKNQQLLTMAYGSQDFFLRTAAGGTQTIGSVGATVDLFLQAGQLPIPNFAGVLPSARTSFSTFPNFTNPPTANSLIARFSTVNGFLEAAPGVTNTEILSTFTPSVGVQGSTQGYLSVDNTVGQFIAPGRNLFENNQFRGIDTGIDLDPVTPGIQNNRLADARFVFATQTLPNFSAPNDWTVSVSGPVQTLVIPEPTAALFGLGCFMPLLAARRRKALA